MIEVVPIEANIPTTSARLANPEVRESAPENKNLPKRAATALGLGVMAVIGHKIQTSGLTYEMDDGIRIFTDSFKHPVVGYAGAAAGHMATKLAARRSEREISRRETIGSIAIGATVANFGAEEAQSLFYAIDEYKNYFSVQQTPETIKDYAFALAGARIYCKQSLSKENSLTQRLKSFMGKLT